MFNWLCKIGIHKWKIIQELTYDRSVDCINPPIRECTVCYKQQKQLSILSDRSDSFSLYNDRIWYDVYTSSTTNNLPKYTPTNDDLLHLDMFAGDFGSPSDRELSNQMIVARLEHECCECNRIIKPKESYRKSIHIFDGEFHSFKWCTDCLTKWYNEIHQ